MRRDLVEAVLDAASFALFEDVVYTPSGGAPETVEQSIFGVQIAVERFEMMDQPMRDVTHTARALKAKFPHIARGDVIDDGTAYRVLDFEPVGDGRLEILISLKVA